MQKKKGLNVTRLVVRTASTGLIMAFGLGPAGCAKQMARIESNQLRLQRMAQANTQQITDKMACIEHNQFGLQKMAQTNAEQIADNLARIEQSQVGLQACIEEVQNNTVTEASNIMAALKEGQMKLRTTVQDTHKQLRADIAVVDKNQRGLQDQIEHLQQNVQTVAAATRTIEQNQRGSQGQIEHLQQNIQTIAAATRTVEQSLLQLQESLLNSTRDLASIIDLIGQEQLKFEERLQNDVRATADTVSAIHQNQAKLQGQIADVQTTTKALSNIAADLDRLKTLLSDRLSEISAAATLQTEPSGSQIEE
jgi:chromosome segregation ATPase